MKLLETLKGLGITTQDLAKGIKTKQCHMPKHIFCWECPIGNAVDSKEKYGDGSCVEVMGDILKEIINNKMEEALHESIEADRENS